MAITEQHHHAHGTVEAPYVDEGPTNGPPDALVLDIGEAEAQARMAARGLPPDRYDRLGPDFHARVAAGFRAIAAGAPQRCVVVPAAGPADAVQTLIRAALSPRLRL